MASLPYRPCLVFPIEPIFVVGLVLCYSLQYLNYEQYRYWASRKLHVPASHVLEMRCACALYECTFFWVVAPQRSLPAVPPTIHFAALKGRIPYIYPAGRLASFLSVSPNLVPGTINSSVFCCVRGMIKKKYYRISP